MNKTDPFHAKSWAGSISIDRYLIEQLKEQRVNTTLGVYLAICKRFLTLNPHSEVAIGLQKGRNVVQRMPRAALSGLFGCPIAIWCVTRLASLIATEHEQSQQSDFENQRIVDLIKHLNRVILGQALVVGIEAELNCFAHGDFVHLQPVGVSVPINGPTTTIKVFENGDVYSGGKIFHDLRNDTNRDLARVAARLINQKGQKIIIDPYDPLLQENWVVGMSFPYDMTASEIGEESLDAWVSTCRDAFGRLRLLWPEIVDEIFDLETIIVPVQSPGDGFSVSHSADEFWGAVLLSAADSNLFMESLIHEHSHNVLYGLFQRYEFLSSDASSDNKFYSPWRPDARPVYGLFHAVYVFSRVCELYTKLVLMKGSDPKLKNRLAFLRARVEMGCLILRVSKALTPQGISMIEVIENAAKQGRVVDENVYLSDVKARLAEHFENFLEVNPTIDLSQIEIVQGYLDALMSKTTD